MDVVVLVDAGAAAAAPEPQIPLSLGVELRIAEHGLASAADVAAPADVIVVAAGARLSPGWLERLVAAADEQPGAATVQAIAVQDASDEDAAAVAERSLRLRPRRLLAPLDCVLIRRSALQLAGPLDEGFARRCLERGLVHVVADDVLVGGVPATRSEQLLEQVAHGDLPPYPHDRLARAVSWTRRVIRGLDVTLDGRALRTLASGTEVQALALIAALRRTGEARLRVLVDPDAGETVLSALGDVDVLRASVDALTSARRTAIVHRPFQVSEAGDLTVLHAVGERLVVTHLDLILYHDPAYHDDADTWAAYRRLTASGLARADLVAAISDFVADDIAGEDLVAAERLRRVHLGVDHLADERSGPVSAPSMPAGPFLLCLGNDLLHKNRVFAIELLRELRAIGWAGRLVLAGPRMARGSSRAAEDQLLAAHPELAASVVRLDAVSDAERRWLYREAAAVVYPSTTEGFGLIPFEAAAAGTPALFAPIGPLVELLPAELATLVPWDARASAERAWLLLSDSSAAARHAAATRRGAERLTWDATAAAYLKLYDEALRMPARAAQAAAFAALAAEDRRGHWEGMYWALRDEIGPTGLALVGADGALPADAQQALAALAGRNATRAPMLAALRAASRIGARGGLS